MPRTPVESRPLKTRTSVKRKADAFAQPRGEQHIVLIGAGLTPTMPSPASELHGDLAVAVDADEIRQLVAAHVARFGGEHDVELAPIPLRLPAAAEWW